MLYGFIDRVSVARDIKDGLDVSAERTRRIADRVAQANLAGDGFAVALDGALGEEADPVDVEREMVALADEQLRFEAAARLLQKAYQQIRAGLRDR